ncbi:hypothetical protein EYF80_027317 [Liparis tanakae]|uniref:Uncharacterized protein n=1 Tax=Liparis tanakae TaxID=230148 RepID=A0A4Z2HC92_9TELE|nr:hypothetical protein EYF80_027317 [Liparis tanakae]
MENNPVDSNVLVCLLQYLSLKKSISPRRVVTASKTMEESQASGVVGGSDPSPVGQALFLPLLVSSKRGETSKVAIGNATAGLLHRRNGVSIQGPSDLETKESLHLTQLQAWAVERALGDRDWAWEAGALGDRDVGALWDRDREKRALGDRDQKEGALGDRDVGAQGEGELGLTGAGGRGAGTDRDGDGTGVTGAADGPQGSAAVSGIVGSAAGSWVSGVRGSDDSWGSGVGNSDSSWGSEVRGSDDSWGSGIRSARGSWISEVRSSDGSQEAVTTPSCLRGAAEA